VRVLVGLSALALCLQLFPELRFRLQCALNHLALLSNKSIT
jgi:hypothetical protein